LGGLVTFPLLSSIQFIDEQYGWIVGEPKIGIGGFAFQTTDGGKSWTKADFRAAHGLYSVKFLSRNKGWIVGENGMILHTTRGGDSGR